MELLLKQVAAPIYWNVLMKFWPAWIPMALVFIGGLLWTFRYAAPGPSRAAAPAASSLFGVGALALIVAIYVGFVLSWSDYTFYWYDSHIFTQNFLRGQSQPPWIVPSEGRFLPLAHQEFNVIKELTSSGFGFHLLPVMELIAFAAGVYSLLRGIPGAARACLTLLALFVPSALIPFAGLIYTERNVLFLLICMLLFVRRFDREPTVTSAVGAGICAHLMVYFKEPAFVLLLAFSVGRLALRLVRHGHRVLDRDVLRAPSSLLDMWLTAIGCGFLVYYAAIMSRSWNLSYADTFDLSLLQALRLYTTADLLPWILIVAVAIRTYRVAARYSQAEPFWDALALGALGYFLTLIALRVYATYFTAPVDVIAILYLAHMSRRILERGRQQWKAAAIVLVFGVVAIQGFVVSALRLYETLNINVARAVAARSLAAAYARRDIGRGRIFFPFSQAQEVGEFASYFSYTAAQSGSPAAGLIESHQVVFAGPNLRETGRCLVFTEAECVIDAEPKPNDIVVILPDDVAAIRHLDEFAARGRTLYRYSPPVLPRWINAVAHRITVASPMFAGKAIPEAWLHAVVVQLE